ncbi:AppA family phytase/histidine-type acid phosphatase [Escherichia albertii]|uniref:AppA family phytase/histidine-type acid phosphatase n=1 Tax=Escherichia albertii TaxID=208962 RepID=UPI001A99F451|nr:AppA family phytase/histidine-type acid phosphatase [Escherichia albertii]QTA28488.1 AppA family phytase/histidine-type acid phosphatase [Escherichia albertii]
MKVILLPFFSLLLPLTLSPAYAQNEPELKLESVVIVSRHGVRASTKATSLMQDVTPDAWPTWPVKLGWLTPRGGELVSYLGHYQRQRLVADGLLAKKGCPKPGQVAIIADIDERTRKTGEAFAAGLAPGCVLPVHTLPDTSRPDPLFNPLKTGICQLDKAKVTGAILNRAGGSIAGFTEHRQTAFCELERVLNFSQSRLCLKREKQGESCSLTQVLPSELNVSSDNVSLTGAVSLASMLTEIFLLQQAQGMPQPGWGRITDSQQWNTLLSLHNAQFYLLQRTPEVARSRATPLLDLVLTALTAHGLKKQSHGVMLPTSLLFIVGHDTNLANLGGALGLNWTLPGQLDNTPPGGEMVFERWRRLSDNSQWIQASFVFQTLQQMRDKTPLSLKIRPGEVKLTLAGCKEINAQGMCSLVGFTQIVNKMRIPACSL